MDKRKENEYIYFLLGQLNNFYPNYSIFELLSLVKKETNEDLIESLKQKIEEEKDKTKIYQPIKKYKLKDGITKQDLINVGFSNGGWLKEVKFPKVGIYKTLLNDIEVRIEINTETLEFDCFDNILVLDDNFAQPYGPFYDKSDRVFKGCAKIRKAYNEFMDNLGIFEEIKNERK